MIAVGVGRAEDSRVICHSREKCKRFLNFCDFSFKNFEVQGLDFLCTDFLCLVWGVGVLAHRRVQRPPVALVVDELLNEAASRLLQRPRVDCRRLKTPAKASHPTEA